MKKVVLYIHGKGGCTEEVEHYRPFFRGCDVIGLDYASKTPWEAKEEFPKLLAAAQQYRRIFRHERLLLRKNCKSLFYFSCCGYETAYF